MSDPQSPSAPPAPATEPMVTEPMAADPQPSRRGRLAAWRSRLARRDVLTAVAAAAVVFVVGLGGFWLGHATADDGGGRGDRDGARHSDSGGRDGGSQGRGRDGDRRG